MLASFLEWRCLCLWHTFTQDYSTGTGGRNSFRESAAATTLHRLMRWVCVAASCMPDDALGRPFSCVEDILGCAWFDCLVVRSFVRGPLGRVSWHCGSVAVSSQGIFRLHFLGERYRVGYCCSFGLSCCRVRGRCGRFRCCGEDGSSSKQEPAASRVDLLKDVIGSVRASLLGACAIAFAVAITRVMSLAGTSGMGEAINGLCVLLTGCAAVVLLLLMRKKNDGGVGIPTLFQILFPIVATLLLVASVSGSIVAMLVGAAVFSIYSIVFALVMPACIDGAMKSKVLWCFHGRHVRALRVCNMGRHGAFYRCGRWSLGFGCRCVAGFLCLVYG